QSGRSFTIAATGDVLIHQVIALAADGHAPGQGTYDFRPLFRPIEPWIAEADFAICHLEGTLSPTNTGLLYQTGEEHPAYFNGPHEVADALVATGYDACSTAGNHALDRGLSGVRETLEVLDAAALGHTGTARDADERLPTFYRVNGVRVAHLAYTLPANEPLPGDARWSINIIGAANILADAHWARRSGAEFTVVSLHWGTQYQVAPDGPQASLAETLTASPDVDLILGHHVHVVQPIARVNG
ncbi:MAG: CapA family protein, partial [Actinomycetota bacterium]